MSPSSEDIMNIVSSALSDAISGNLSYVKMLEITRPLLMCGHYKLVSKFYQVYIDHGTSPFHGFVFCDFGDLLIKVGDLSGAEDAYRKALGFSGTLHRARQALSKFVPSEFEVVRDEGVDSVRRVHVMLRDEDVNICPMYYNEFGVFFDQGGRVVNSNISNETFKQIFGTSSDDFDVGMLSDVKVYNSKLYIPSFNPSPHNYYHLMVDHISRIIASISLMPERVGIVTSDAQFKILRQIYKNNIFSDCIDELGLSDSVEVINHHLVRLEKCCPPDNTSSPKYLLQSIPVFQSASQEILDRTSPYRRIYIKRSLPSGRCVANEDDVLKTLDRFGFQVVTLEGMSFRDQMVLFRDADFIIGPHGAGFTNLVFSRKGAVVLELLHEHSPEEQYNFFSIISSLVGCKHMFMVCNSTSHPLYALNIQFNMHVDCNLLSSVVERFIRYQN